MTKRGTIITLQAHQMPAKEGGAPEWVHLLPTSKGSIQTGDNRGPYHVEDAQAVIDASFAGHSKLPIDENHATDLAAPKGLPAPARGWIVEMEARDDGIWGRVEWTEDGEVLVASRAYAGLSPVIQRSAKSKTILGILRASLVNRPNLRGLTELNQEDHDMFQETVAGWLGLKTDASEADIETAIKGLTSSTELQSQLGEIATVLGVEDGGDVVAAAKAAKAEGTGKDGNVTELQSAITELQGTVTELQQENKNLRADREKDAAVAYVDGEIKKGRVGLKPQRDTYIEMHQENPERVKSLVEAMPIITPSGATDVPPTSTGTVTELNAEQKQAAQMLGVTAEVYVETLNAERQEVL